MTNIHAKIARRVTDIILKKKKDKVFIARAYTVKSIFLKYRILRDANYKGGKEQKQYCSLKK